MNDVVTRAMKIGDAEPLSRAFTEIGWNKPASVFHKYFDESAAGKRWLRLAEWKGRLAGYVTVVWNSDDPDFRMKGTPEIMDLNVLPEFRKMGIGSVLLDEAEAEAAKRTEMVGIRVGLHKGYGPAQRLYVRRGYTPDGSGVLVRGRVPEEGAEVRLDDETTLRLTKHVGSR